MTERTTVRLPAELLFSAKQKALAEGRTLTALIEDGLRRVVEEKRATSRTISIPVSTETGGFLPGMSIRKAEELDDLDYVERLRNGFR